MRKNQVEKFTLKSLIFLGLLFLVFACQKDDTSNGKDESINIQEPEITTIENFGHTDSRFNNLKEALNIDVYLKSKSALAQSRTTKDTLGLTIATDIIKQVTLGDYTSYTMEVVQETDSTVFYNLTIEYKNGETGMFVTKYTPTQYWLDNTNGLYQGDIETARINELTEYTDIDQAFDEDLVGGNNNYDLGAGVGGNGSDDNYQVNYPLDCLGTVVATTELIPYSCGCGHMPGDNNCLGCYTASPKWAGYDQITYYTCIEDNYDPVDGNTDTTSGGQTLEGDDPSEDDGSIAAMIKPEECTEHIVGDLNSDCTLSPYEVCLLNGYNQDVCDCVALGNQLSDCLDDDEIYIAMDKECQSNQIQNFTTNTDNSIVEFIRNTFVGNDNLNLSFEDVDIPTSFGANANTTLPNNLSFNENTAAIISFDNAYLDSATDLSIVMSTTHEYIHVWLAYLYSQGTLLNNFPTYTSLNSAFQTFQNDSSPNNGVNLANEMHNVYDDFLDIIIDAVFNYASDNNISDADYEYCEKLVIGAHQNTDAFQNLSIEEQNQYVIIAFNEQQGNTNAYGNNCE